MPDFDICGWAATHAGSALEPVSIRRPPIAANEIKIKVQYVGLCHSDLHLIDGDWESESVFPQICGHEIVGVIAEKGVGVDRFSIGQRVGVGWQANACFTCEACLNGDEPLCEHVVTSCSAGQIGGFADYFVCASDFVFSIPDVISSPEAAPLLCAGITVYGALEPRVRPGMRIAVLGIGGLGHLAIQFASNMGAVVTAVTTSQRKRDDALKLGAHDVVELSELSRQNGRFDLILVTSGHDYDWRSILKALRTRGEVCFVGMPAEITLDVNLMISRLHSVTTSNIGGRAGIRRMFEFAAQFNIRPIVEVLSMLDINQAVDRLRKNDTRFRIVLHAADLSPANHSAR